MHKGRILVIDDSKFDLRLIERILQSLGHEPICLSDGSDCLKDIESHKPDLVLLDVMMPTIDGNEVLKNIRAVFNSVELPVMMITVRSEASDIVESLKLGANDYITKPIDFAVLSMRIQTQFSLKRSAAELSQLGQLKAVQAMVATYNHEINNPLMIAIGSLESSDPKATKRLEDALWRIAEIVKKIDELTHTDLQFDDYSKRSKMLKVK